MASEQEKLMKVQDFKKNVSIAFFNANNVAATLVELETKIKAPKGKKGKGKKPKAVALTDRIIFYRDWLIKEHMDYYSKVIAPVAENFKKEDAITALQATKSKEELIKVWNLLSEDERHNEDILKVARELRVAYPNE